MRVYAIFKGRLQRAHAEIANVLKDSQVLWGSAQLGELLPWIWEGCWQ